MSIEQSALDQIWEALSQINGQEVSGGPYPDLGNIVVCIPKQQMNEQKLMILYPGPSDEKGNFILLPPSKIEYYVRTIINGIWEAWAIQQA